MEEFHKQEIVRKKHREEAKAQVLFEQKGFCKEGGEGDGDGRWGMRGIVYLPGSYSTSIQYTNLSILISILNLLFVSLG